MERREHMKEIFEMETLAKHKHAAMIKVMKYQNPE